MQEVCSSKITLPSVKGLDFSLTCWIAHGLGPGFGSWDEVGVTVESRFSFMAGVRVLLNPRVSLLRSTGNNERSVCVSQLNVDMLSITAWLFRRSRTRVRACMGRLYSSEYQDTYLDLLFIRFQRLAYFQIIFIDNADFDTDL